MDTLGLIGRKNALFNQDVAAQELTLADEVRNSKFLVIGGAGSIGQAVCREIFKRDPKLLHVIDISENNLVELVRDLRSTVGYTSGEFKTFAIDCGGPYFEKLVQNTNGYDYVLNLSALKHVRSEKDPYTLMRLIDTNIFNTVSTLQITNEFDLKKYFCVSTDKAANPVNLMGASKRIMELFMMRESKKVDVGMARFANVAFSDGSLLHGFNQRFLKKQPITAPKDVLRYFLTPQESGELCLMSCLLGDNKDIFFPKLNESLHLTSFVDIARRYVISKGYKVHECASEEEARGESENLISKGHWPCFFFSSDTSGEKGFEEFHMEHEKVDFGRFEGIGIVKNRTPVDENALDVFVERISHFRMASDLKKKEIVDSFKMLLPEFSHIETGKHLDNRM